MCSEATISETTAQSPDYLARVIGLKLYLAIFCHSCFHCYEFLSGILSDTLSNNILAVADG